MKWLGKLMGKKKTYPKNSQFKICVINENADMVNEVLGITEERAKKLADVALKAYDSCDKKTDSLQLILDECSHINEVIFGFECYTRITELKKKQHGIVKMLDQLFGGDE